MPTTTRTSTRAELRSLLQRNPAARGHRFTRRFASSLLVLGLLGTAVAAPSIATADPSAQDKDTARDLVHQGDAQMEKKDWAGALKSYQGARSLVDNPITCLAVAQAQEKMGLLTEAKDSVTHVQQIPVAPDESDILLQARRDAAALVADLDKRIPSVHIQVTGTKPTDDITVSVDGDKLTPQTREFPRHVNPGDHTILVEAKGYASSTLKINTPEGNQTVEVPIELKPEVAKPPIDNQPPDTDKPGKKINLLLPIGAAITGVGLGVGIGTGAAALGSCKTKGCALGWVSDIGFIAAAGGAAMGIAGLILTLNAPAPKEDPKPADPASGDPPKADPKTSFFTITPLIGPTYWGVSGTF